MSETSLPAPHQQAAAELRVTAPAEILSLLREVQERHLLLTLAAPDGASYSTALWTITPEQQSMSLQADAGDARLQSLLEAGDVIAVAYLDRIKVQFQLDNLLLVTGPEGSALRADIPTEMFRFQRRSAFRVQPLDTGTPRLTLSDPQAPASSLSLRVLDVSMGGVAVFLPEDIAPGAAFPSGTALGLVQLQLDRNTRFDAPMKVQHVSRFHAESKGVQLGCAFEALSPPADRILHRYVEQTQKRRRLLQAR